MSDLGARIGRNVYAAVAWFAIGCIASGYFRPVAPAPAPVPAPITAPIAPELPKVRHTGHLTVSYIEPRYPTPASAAVRDALAGIDWHALDCTFRSYTDGQDELTTLGFVSHFAIADLPVLFVQETGPKGAPIIDTIKGPTAAEVVTTRVKELRGL